MWHWTTYWLCKFLHVASVFDLPLVKSMAHKSNLHFRYLLLPFAYTFFFFFSLVRNCLEDNMVGSITVGSSNTPSVGFSSLPKCGCDRAMKMWVANTVRNRNKKFWRCRNAGVRKLIILHIIKSSLWYLCVNVVCDMFVWDDGIGHCMNENTNISSSCKNCEMANVKLEITTKKLEKAKMKIGVQKKKYFNWRWHLWSHGLCLQCCTSLCNFHLVVIYCSLMYFKVYAENALLYFEDYANDVKRLCTNEMFHFVVIQ